MSEEFEVGRDIDQAIRSAIIIISQAIERQARKSARGGGDPGAIAEQLETRLRESARQGAEAVTTRAVQVVIPAGSDNTDRGLDPARAKTPQERAHRERTWQMAYDSHREQGGNEASWASLPEQDKRRLAEQAYDLPEARTVSLQLPDGIADGVERVQPASADQPVRAVSRWDDGTDLPVVVTGPAVYSRRDGLWYAPTKDGGPVPTGTLIGTDFEALGYTPEWADSVGIGATHVGRFDAAAKESGEKLAAAQVPALPRYADYGDALNPETAGALSAQQRIEAFTAASVDLIERPTSPAAALAVRKIGEELKRRHNVDPATIMADVAAERAADRRAPAAGRGRNVTPEAAPTQTVQETRDVTIVIPAGDANPARGRKPREDGITPQEREHRAAAWREAQEQYRLDPRNSGTAWKDAPFQQKAGIYNSVYDREDVRTVTIELPVDVADQVQQVADATPSNPRPLVVNTGGTQVPVLVTGRAVQASPDGPWMAPHAHGAPVPLEGLMEPTAEEMGYSPAWVTDDGSFDREAFVAAVDAAHGRTPTPQTSEAAEQAVEAAVSRERVIELNGQAADFFAARNVPGAPGHTYMTDRLGPQAVEASPFALGYAPGPAGRAGWTSLTEHLRGQGATDEELVAAGLGQVSARGTVIDTFRDRAMIGIRDVDGNVVGFAGRDLSGAENAPKYTNTKGTPAFTKGDHLLGLHEAPEGARLVRVEGPFDALAITAAGNGQVAGVAPSGTALTRTQAQLLAEHGQGRVWLALDNDTAGRAALVKDYEALGTLGASTRALDLPDGMDPAALWADNPGVLRSVVSNADDARYAGEVVIDVFREQLAERLESDDEDVRTEAQIELAAEEDAVRASIMSAKDYDGTAAEAIGNEHGAEPTSARSAEGVDTHGTVETTERERPYDRARTSSHMEALEPDTREARQVSADGYTRSTLDGTTAARNTRHQPSKGEAARRTNTPDRTRTLRR